MQFVSHVNSAFGMRKCLSVAQSGASVDDIYDLVSSSCFGVYKVFPRWFINRSRDDFHFGVYVVRIDSLPVSLYKARLFCVFSTTV